MYDNFLLHFLQTNQYFALKRGTNEIAGKSRDDSTLHLVPYFQGPITTISRRHFKLSYNNHGLFIEDLASTNGTEVNGEALSPEKRKRLFHGDLIRIAENKNFVIEVIDEKSGTDVINETIQAPPPPPPPPEHGVYFHEHENTFYLDGKPLDRLEQRAMDVLKYLYQYKKQECSSYHILREVFSRGTTIHSVRAAVSSIRAKFDEISPGSKTRYLKTVHGYGYKLVTE